MKAALSIFALLVIASNAGPGRGPRPPAIGAPAESPVAVPAGAAERLAGSLRIRTVSPEQASEADAFAELHAYLETSFPTVHATLRRETVSGHSLLYTWPGHDPALKPILLAGHLDVVPIEPGTEGQWREDPFGGRIADGFIWGRGSIDNKSAVVGILEAIEMLLRDGFRPARTVYLAFGHDEEVGGAAGAARIAALLTARGVELELVLDEGGVIGEGVLPGITRPVALVGIAEKGFVTLELRATAAGGHSSLPPRQTAAGMLGAAIARLEAQPMRARLEGPTRHFLETIAPQLPAIRRAMLANLWLTAPFVVRSLETAPATNAMLRTTTAVTMLRAGTKDNVLPSTASAVVNVRILPGDSIASVVEHVTRVIDDERIEVRRGGHFSAEPSSASPTDSDAFRAIEQAIRSIAPDVIVAPYLVVVVTDARYYAAISRHVFRFLPLRLGPRDLERMHGIDERIGVVEYEEAVRTYRQLLVKTAG